MGKIVEGMFREESAWRLLHAMNEQATGRTDVDVFPAAVAKEVQIDPDTDTFFAVVGYLESEDYIDSSPNATLVGATVFRITQRGMAWLKTPPPGL
jgi:hypothetical protein